MIHQDERPLHALRQLITDFSQYLAVQCSTKCPTFDHMIINKKGFQSHYVNEKNVWRKEVLFEGHWCPCFGLRAISALGFKPGWIQEPWLGCNRYLKFTFSATASKLLIMAVWLLLHTYFFKQTELLKSGTKVLLLSQTEDWIYRQEVKWWTVQNFLLLKIFLKKIIFSNFKNELNSTKA